MSGLASEQIETLDRGAERNHQRDVEHRAARRSGAGRSAADIKALPTAQAELKTRAEEMRARADAAAGAIRFPQQIVPPGSPRRASVRRRAAGQAGSGRSGGRRDVGHDARDRAAGRAEDGEALPHEMAALRGCCRRRPRSAGARWRSRPAAAWAALGRQGQDLSALFDKELQRQQRTNYETRSQIETRPDREESESALDRIRDLARRQEELSRRQRELAKAALSAEEMKRQLEKLTREQEELRQQAEELAREMGQQAAGQQPGQPAGQPQRGGSSPAQSGAQAAPCATRPSRCGARRANCSASAVDGCRSRRAGGGRAAPARAADAPRTARRAAAALGDRRLEAQQIAEAQRRIADEAARLAKGAAPRPRGAAPARGRKGEAGRPRRRAAASRPSSSAAIAGAGRAGPVSRLRPPRRSRASRSPAACATARGRCAMRPTPKAPRGAAPPSTRRRRARRRRTADRHARSNRRRQLGGGAAGAADLSHQLDETRAIRERLDGSNARCARPRRRRRRQAGPGQGRRAGAGRTARRVSRGRVRARPGAASDAQRLREDTPRSCSARARRSRGCERGSPRRARRRDARGARVQPLGPGTEAFKQDFSKWESLRKDVDSRSSATRRRFASASRRSSQDRLSAGGSERVPDAYRRLIARYYESLARKK